MSESDFKNWNAKKAAKIPKFRNKKKVVNGLEFDSTKEARRWQDLVLWQSSGQITGLVRQHEYPLFVNGILICRYVADFVYNREGQAVVEDVKSKPTREKPDYIIKKKLMKAIFNFEIQEI
jgi:hypothetical protein